MDWDSIIANVVPMIAGGLGGGAPGALYGLGASARNNIETDLERQKINADITYKNQAMEQNQQRMRLDRLNALPEVFKVGQHLSETLSDEDRATVAPQFGQLIRDSGMNIDDAAVGALLSNKPRLQFLTGAYGDVIKNLPMQDKIKLADLLSKDPAKADKLMGQYAFGQAQQIKDVGGDIPDRIAAMLDDDQRLQLNIPTKATLQKKQEREQGLQSGDDNLSNIQAAIVRSKAMKPDGTIDPDKALDVMKELRTNPQGAEGRMFDEEMKKANGNYEVAAREWIKKISQVSGSRSESARVGQGRAESSPEAIQGRTDITAAGQVGRIEGGRGTQLGDRATNYINPEDLTTASPAMTEQAAIDKGFRAFKGANASQFVTMSRSAMNILNRLDELSQKLLPQASGSKVADVINTRKNQVSLNARYQARDPEVMEFYALLGSNLAQFAKAAGDAANIAVPEQEFQKSALPGSADTQESARQLIQSKKAILRGVLESAVGAKPIPKQDFPGGKGGSGPKQLDQATAAAIFKEVGGDAAKARALAKQRGYTIPSE